MPHSIMRVDIAGRDVTRHLRLLLRKEGINFKTTAEFEIVRTIKERACYLASNPQKEETIETEKFQYVLPDGSHLEVTLIKTQTIDNKILYITKCAYFSEIVNDNCSHIYILLNIDWSSSI